MYYYKESDNTKEGINGGNEWQKKANVYTK